VFGVFSSDPPRRGIEIPPRSGIEIPPRRGIEIRTILLEKLINKDRA
jgi:hypothetical protein